MNPEIPLPGSCVHRDPQQVRLTLTAHPNTLAVVRRMVRSQLVEWECAALTHTAAMCATELLSNVHKHARSAECVLTLRRITDGIRISVTDDEPAMPVVCEPDQFSERGRGLFLMSRTADEWGVVPTGSGKEVWFTLRPEAV